MLVLEPPPLTACAACARCSSSASSGAISAWKSVRTTSSRIAASELLEHHVPLVAVLDERVLLRHRAQVDTLAQVVHLLEVLAPPGSTTCRITKRSTLAHQLLAELLLLLAVRVRGVLLELFDRARRA